MRTLPWLLQRVVTRRTVDGKGLDAYFEFDYMGSSEFEWGVLPRTLKIMRGLREKDRAATPPVEWKVELIDIEVALNSPSKPNLIEQFDITAYFVGTPDDMEMAEKCLRDQLRESPTYRTKEYTRMREAFGVVPGEKAMVDGWWAVDAGWDSSYSRDIPLDLYSIRPFVIFRKREHAELWLKEM